MKTPTLELTPQQTTNADESAGPGSRWDGIRRPYTAADVERLRASVRIEHTLARRGAERLWQLLASRDYVAALGALTGNQAVQQVRAGLEAIYLRGWQVAADANLAGQTYRDQSLYPANSVPAMVRRINQALIRADEVEAVEGARGTHEWFAPIVADSRRPSIGRRSSTRRRSRVFSANSARWATNSSSSHWQDFTR